MVIEEYTRLRKCVEDLIPFISPYVIGVAIMGSVTFIPLEEVRDLDIGIFVPVTQTAQVHNILQEHQSDIPKGLDLHVVRVPQDIFSQAFLVYQVKYYNQLLYGKIPDIGCELEDFMPSLKQQLMWTPPYRRDGVSTKHLYHFLASYYLLQSGGQAFTEEQLQHLRAAHNRQIYPEDLQLLQDYFQFRWDDSQLLPEEIERRVREREARIQRLRQKHLQEAEQLKQQAQEE